MRKEFDIQKESFLEFSASLIAGDTAILNAVSLPDDWLHYVSNLLERGVLVRTPGQVPMDTELRRDADAVEGLARLAAVIDRKVGLQDGLRLERAKAIQVEKRKTVLEAKVHQLIEERGLGVVAACRKVHCRPSDYYIYRSKLKAKSYGR